MPERLIPGTGGAAEEPTRSGTAPAAGVPSPDPAPGPGEPPHRPVRTELGVLLGVCLLVGGVAGVLWSLLSDLPGYVIGADSAATTTERGLAEHFSGDAWFCLIGVVGGLLIGLLVWWRLRWIGWPVMLVALGGSLLAAGLTWLVGSTMGPGDFDARLADAVPGDTVSIELTLRAPVAIVVWPFVATIPILLWSSLAPDEEDPRPLLGWSSMARRSRRRHESVAGVLPEDREQLGAVAVPRPRDEPDPGRVPEEPPRSG